MNQEIIKTISEELNVRVHQIEAVLSLLEEGNTVPFIARYRKEKTDRKSTRLNSSHIL